MEDAFARKKLPYNLDAEKSVIGSMLMDRDAIVEASDMLTKEDFYYGQYGILFENMVELFKEGKAVDLVTLKNKLEENNVPDEVIRHQIHSGDIGDGSDIGECQALCRDRCGQIHTQEDDKAVRGSGEGLLS